MPEPLTDPATSATELLETSLGFGCAGLYSQPSRGERTRVLETAYNAGVRHFDTAPMYGLGLAQRELGHFAHGRRDQLVIATKFGVAPALAAWPLARVQGPIRRLLRASPALKRKARSSAGGPSSGRVGSLLYRATGFDATSARAGLENSLRELGTDYIDLFLLHDPQPGSISSDDVCAFLDDARRSGRIRAWGVAGEPPPSIAVARELAVQPPVLQIRDDVLAPVAADSWPTGVDRRITFGLLGRSIGSVVSHVGVNHARRRRWRDAVGVDCADAEVAAGLLLRLGARRNPGGVVLFSTTSVGHVVSCAAAIDSRRGGSHDLDAFDSLLDAELRGRQPSSGAQR